MTRQEDSFMPILQSQLFRDFQHTLDRLYSFLSYFCIYGHFRPFILQGIVELFKSIQAHEITFIARTASVFWRNRYEILFRTLLAHLVKNTTFSSHNKVLFRAVYSMFQQSGSRGYLIRQLCYSALSFRVNKHIRIRVLLLQFENLHHRELFVYVTSTVPKQHFSTCNRVNVVS